MDANVEGHDLPMKGTGAALRDKTAITEKKRKALKEQFSGNHCQRRQSLANRIPPLHWDVKILATTGVSVILLTRGRVVAGDDLRGIQMTTEDCTTGRITMPERLTVDHVAVKGRKAGSLTIDDQLTPKSPTTDGPETADSLMSGASPDMQIHLNLTTQRQGPGMTVQIRPLEGVAGVTGSLEEEPTMDPEGGGRAGTPSPTMAPTIVIKQGGEVVEDLSAEGEGPGMEAGGRATPTKWARLLTRPM